MTRTDTPVAGAYERLIGAFHADADPGRRQEAAREIAVIAPTVSHDAMEGADTAAAAVLARLYPPEER